MHPRLYHITLCFFVSATQSYCGTDLQDTRSVIDTSHHSILTCTGSDSTFDLRTALNSDIKGNEKRKSVIQPDGKIVTVGSCYGHKACITRFMASGALDTSFGTGGTVAISPLGHPVEWSYYFPKAITLQNDGPREKRIIIGGTYSKHSLFTNEGFLVRLLSDGTIDKSFGIDGHIRTKLASDGVVSEADSFYSIATDEDGSIVAVGRGGAINAPQLRVARYKKDGALDSLFGTMGIKKIDDAGTTACADRSLNSVTIEGPGGAILTGGTVCNTGTVGDIFITRLNARGDIDTSFGTGGYVIKNIVGQDEPAAIIFTGSRIIVAMNTHTRVLFSYLNVFGFFGLTVNGQADPGFAGGGVVLVDSGLTSDIDDSPQSSYMTSASMGIDGKIIAVGQAQNGSRRSLPFLTRFNLNGVLDTSIGRNGRFLWDCNGGGHFSSVAVQKDLKIVTTGFWGDSSRPDSDPTLVGWGVARFVF